jgi:hypothetical protein
MDPNDHLRTYEEMNATTKNHFDIKVSGLQV